MADRREPENAKGARPAGARVAAPLLEIQGLGTHFVTDRGVVRAVDGVDLRIEEREILGLVGESGCGKSMMARSILRIVPRPGRIVSGRILFEGNDLLLLSEKEMRSVRGAAIGMVFQEPMMSLNPSFRVGNQIAEVLSTHRPDMGRSERDDRVIELLRTVGIPSPAQRAASFPHQISGGMSQRVMIAMALAAGNTRLLIADEPTTALDVTIQAQILELFQELQRERSMAVMLITHDLGIVAKTASHIAVMYAGSIVEYAETEELFFRPMHPYTLGLLKSLPGQAGAGQKSTLFAIPGSIPNLATLTAGCKFFDRCPFARREVCLGTEPALEVRGANHLVRCRRVDDVARQR